MWWGKTQIARVVLGKNDTLGVVTETFGRFIVVGATVLCDTEGIPSEVATLSQLWWLLAATGACVGEIWTWLKSAGMSLGNPSGPSGANLETQGFTL